MQPKSNTISKYSNTMGKNKYQEPRNNDNTVISNVLHDAVENYYHYNPNMLMPLMLVALAANGNLGIYVGTRNPEISACVLYPEEIKGYDWVLCDETLKHRVNKWIKDGVTIVAAEMEVGRSLLQIYNTFKRNDEIDVVQEYHNRIGMLLSHSSNLASEKAHRQYATLVLTEVLINTPVTYLKSHYLNIFNFILEKSGLQPQRPRLDVARALTTLLSYDGKGLVYNPFAGCSIAGAMLNSKENFYGDGDSNDKLYSAGLLLNYGMGVSNEHFIQRDSTLWLAGKTPDYVISTYTGFVYNESAFDFCLEKCLYDPDFKGRYAGIVLPKEIFDKQTANFKKALDRDWIESIVLLPFGEAAVLINAQKANEQKGIIRFIDGTNPLALNETIEDLIENKMFSKFIKVSDAKKKGSLKSLVISELPERAGYKKIRLRDIVSQIPRVVYSLDKFDEDQQVLAYINRNEAYYGQPCRDENIERKPIHNLFNPAYLLKEDCLIVNASGAPEPRIFGVDMGQAFFEDGYAFSLKGFNRNGWWLIHELNESYVRRQLHQYGLNHMVPEPLTEEDYLNLILYQKIGFDIDSISNICNLEDMDSEGIYMQDQIQADEFDALPIGFELKEGNKKYTILNFISNGDFGYTYRAEMLNCSNGTTEIVAIKEFYPQGVLKQKCRRENNRVIYDPCCEEQFNSYKKMFRSEHDFILSMADTPDNHVTEVKSIFESEATGTIYYVMKYYAGETLEDMITNYQVPSSERLIVEKIVVPLCKALYTMHSHNILHLDIKPNNVVLDENGEAVLIDFGVAQQYDEIGRLISLREAPANSPYSAPQNRSGNMRYFCPQADIFGTATTLFALITGGMIPKAIENRVEEFAVGDSMNCSEEMKHAIIEGMALYANDRPANAQLFLNLFPGCESIEVDSPSQISR